MATFTVNTRDAYGMCIVTARLTLDAADSSLYRVHLVGIGYSADVLRFPMKHTTDRQLDGSIALPARGGRFAYETYVEKYSGGWQETEFKKFGTAEIGGSEYNYLRAAGIEYNTAGGALGEANYYCVAEGFETAPPQIVNGYFYDGSLPERLDKPTKADGVFMYWNIPNEGDKTKYEQNPDILQPFSFINGQTYTATAVWKPLARQYIDTGTEWIYGTPYIDTGTSWQQYKPYI